MPDHTIFYREASLVSYLNLFMKKAVYARFLWLRYIYMYFKEVITQHRPTIKNSKQKIFIEDVEEIKQREAP